MRGPVGRWRGTWIAGGLLLLLLLYTGLQLAFPDSGFKSDSGRYVKFATNLSRGFYSPADAPDLTNGPGYPLVLAPIALMGLPWSVASALNVLFMLGAVAYTFAALRLYLDESRALLGAAFVGLYPPALPYMLVVSAEPISLFLVAGFAYHLCRAQRGKARVHLAASAGFLAYLALTKVFFGYVAATMLIGSAFAFAWRRDSPSRRTLAVAAGALLMCAPWLAYTYSLTGRVFYWGSTGGGTLYWMSSPFPQEYGDWYGDSRFEEAPEVRERHRELLDAIEGLSPVEQEARFTRQALANIRAHPAKYSRNWLLNVTRLLFNYPYSYTRQKPTTFLYLLPNIVLVGAGIAAAFVWTRRWRKVPPEIWTLGFLSLVSLGGSSLVSSGARQFLVLVPWLVVSSAFCLGTFVRCRLVD
jgi:hypothetical protein